jgi:hypothetical protein
VRKDEGCVWKLLVEALVSTVLHEASAEAEMTCCPHGMMNSCHIIARDFCNTQGLISLSEDGIIVATRRICTPYLKIGWLAKSPFACKLPHFVDWKYTSFFSPQPGMANNVFQQIKFNVV